MKQATILDSTRKRFPFYARKLHWLGLCILLCSFPCRALQAPAVPATKSALPELGRTEAPTPGAQNDQLRTGSITGNVVDQSGAFIPGALVKLTREGQLSGTEVFSDDDGQFSFSNVAPGSFQLTITSAGLASQEFSFTLEPGEVYVTPLIMLNVATQVTEVRVALTPVELANAELKEQEKQRVLGFIPNFYVSYVPEAAPLTAKHKFELAWKSSTDPITFVGVGAIAGLDQMGDRWGAYGQGVQGYSKRFAATYADVFAGTFIGSAILPSLLKQDPRYFYKGKGTKRSRIFYALANSVICKGDNRRWQPNYSSIAGNLAAGGLSNLYYPANDRNGLGTVVTTALIRLGETAVANIFQEFLVPKLTPNLPTRAPSQP
jgi:Carboxypeptidase regulatory-like domain